MSALDPRLREALSHVVDPEIGLDVVALGLVYGATMEDGIARVELTMTTPACPQQEVILEDARNALENVEGVTRADVELVFEPHWTPARMSDEAKRTLGWQQLDEETT
jgi:metal-sulfur cluster biosynthetic enzyme